MTRKTINQTSENRTLSRSVILWRYLDLSKFMALLHSSSLYFSRADQFSDKFEGSFTESVKKKIESDLSEHDIGVTYLDYKNALKEKTFINCWHSGTKDNMAMWRIYGNFTHALAVTTTAGKLEKQLESHNNNNIIIRRVKYINHFNDPHINVNNHINIFTYKHEAYEFEKEVRVIISKNDNLSSLGQGAIGFNLKVDLSSLIRSIVVSPDAPRWFCELIYEICSNFNLQHLIEKSELANNPI